MFHTWENSRSSEGGKFANRNDRSSTEGGYLFEFPYLMLDPVLQHSASSSRNRFGHLVTNASMCDHNNNTDFDDDDYDYEELFCVKLGDFYHSYEGGIPWDTFAVLRIVIASFNIAVFAIVLLPYIYVIWILVTKCDFKSSMPYRIMINISLMDLVFMLENLMAGYMVLRPNDYYLFLQTTSEILGAIRMGTLQSSPFLSLVLAINRFMAVLSIRNGKVITVIFMALIVFSWLLFLPVPVCLHFFSNETVYYTYDVVSGGYVMGGKDTVIDFMGLVGPVLLGAAFFCYVAVVAAIIIKKEFYGSNYKITPLEIRIILQAFLLSVPSAILILTAMLASPYIADYSWVYLCFNIFAAVAPVNTLVNYVVFNSKLSRIIRSHIRELIGGKKVTIVRKPTTVVQTITAQTRLNNASSSVNTNGQFVRRSSERR